MRPLDPRVSACHGAHKPLFVPTLKACVVISWGWRRAGRGRAYVELSWRAPHLIQSHVPFSGLPGFLAQPVHIFPEIKMWLLHALVLFLPLSQAVLKCLWLGQHILHSPWGCLWSWWGFVGSVVPWHRLLPVGIPGPFSGLLGLAIKLCGCRAHTCQDGFVFIIMFLIDQFPRWELPAQRSPGESLARRDCRQ